MYDYGIGVQKDYREAEKLYRKAAEQGYTNAEYQLGLIYIRGAGVERSPTLAAKWWRLAADKEYAPAQHSLGHLYASGMGLETEYLEAPEPPASPQEKAIPGRQSIQGDYVEAAKWWRKAADQGDAPSQCDLGWNYLYGRGVETNYAEAAAWFRKAAERGNVIAEHSLGSLYATGRGVEQDYVTAGEWYRKAADKRYPMAESSLGWMYAHGQGVKKDATEALNWYRKAADTGYPFAQNQLAWMLAISTNESFRNGPMAVGYAEKAVAATHRTNAAFLDTLAAAHAETGDFDKAVATQNEAIALLKDTNSRQDYASRLRLYESKAPYREQETRP
jgi:TPR repeat protein